MGKQWKEKTGSDFAPMVDVKESKGAETVGIYQGSRKVGTGDDASTVHEIEIDGRLHNFWGAGQLNYLLKDVEPGTEIKIQYNGMEKVAVMVKGRKIKKEVHQFKLFVAE